MPTPKSPPVIVFVNLPGRPLAKEEIDQIIGRISRSDEQWNALFQFFQRRMYAALIESTAGRLTEREAGIAAGRVAEINGIMEELAEMLDAGVKRKKS